MAKWVASNPSEISRRRAARSAGRSPSAYLGRVPAERHEHYDAEGRLTGYTVIVRESEWTDDDRRQMRELDAYESGVCSGCGVHESVADDPDHYFTFDDRICLICRGIKRHGRTLQRDDATRRDKDDPYAPSPSDGRHVHLRYLPPHEVEELKRKGLVK